MSAVLEDAPIDLGREYGPFSELPRDAKLDALRGAVKHRPELFGSAMWEALAESKLSDEFAAKLWNPAVTDAELGALVRMIQIDYAYGVSIAHDKDLRRYL